MLARINAYVNVHICMNSIHILMYMCIYEYIHTCIHAHVCKVVSEVYGGYTELCVNFPRKSNLKRFPLYTQIIAFCQLKWQGNVFTTGHTPGECLQRKPGGVIYKYNPISWKAEAEGWLVQGQPELHSAPCKEEVGGLEGQFRD